MHVLGTAGHVDHGKSTLIHALTGIDPDRLAEEKRRGLTIDLGFAWMTLPSGREVGIVDVPGHERFVHNMLAGAGSIDAVIFVVAANEGWRPQSEEHLQIIDLLGARGGVVALTKIDIVDDDAAKLAHDDIAERLAHTTLEDAEIVAVSAKTGDGIDDLLGALDALLDRVPASPDLGRPRLFVDRSFTVRGAGTVATGTLTGGSLKAGDEVAVLPRGTRARIRSIQTHRHDRETAEPGSRAALNLAGLERHEIARGDAVTKPGQWKTTTAIDVSVRAVRSLIEPITSRGAYKLYLGSAEVDCRMTLLDRANLHADENAFARLRLSEAVVATETDRFVLRHTGRATTVAGGVVLDAHPAAHGSRPALLARLERRSHADLEEIASLIVEDMNYISTDELHSRAQIKQPHNTIALGAFTAHATWLTTQHEAIRLLVTSFHDREPLAKGIPLDAVRDALGIKDERLFEEVLSASPDVIREGTVVRLAQHDALLTPEQEAVRDRVLADAGGFSPPSLEDLRARHGENVIRALLDTGDLIKVGPSLAFTSDAVGAAKDTIAQAAANEGPLTMSRIRELLGTSRKYAIPLLEHLDAAGFTRRDGDVRTVRR